MGLIPRLGSVLSGAQFFCLIIRNLTFVEEEEFVGFLKEELGIHSDVEDEIHNVIKLLRKLSTKNGQEP